MIFEKIQWLKTQLDKLEQAEQDERFLMENSSTHGDQDYAESQMEAAHDEVDQIREKIASTIDLPAGVILNDLRTAEISDELDREERATCSPVDLF